MSIEGHLVQDLELFERFGPEPFQANELLCLVRVRNIVPAPATAGVQFTASHCGLEDGPGARCGFHFSPKAVNKPSQIRFREDAPARKGWRIFEAARASLHDGGNLPSL